MELSYKVRLYPNKEQENLIQKTFGCVRYVYNYYLERREKVYKNEQRTMRYFECSRELTQLKKENEWLREPDKNALQNTLKHLDEAFTNFFKKNANYPVFKKKRDRHQSYQTTMNNNNIRIQDGKLRLPKIGLVKIKDKRLPKGRILNATVEQVPSGKYFASICCTDVEQPNFNRTDKYVGIDLGLNEFAVTSDGQRFVNHKFLKQSLNKLAKLQRLMPRKTKGGRNWEKARLRVARMHEKVTNQRKDWIHKMTSRLVKQYDVLCIEDLKVRNMMQNHSLAFHVRDVGWGFFIRELTSKAKRYGKEVVKVDTFFPSSQICSHCGEQHKITKDLDVRSWVCPSCETKLDRDLNAAKNILHEGMRILGIE